MTQRRWRKGDILATTTSGKWLINPTETEEGTTDIWINARVGKITHEAMKSFKYVWADTRNKCRFKLDQNFDHWFTTIQLCLFNLCLDLFLLERFFLEGHGNFKPGNNNSSLEHSKFKFQIILPTFSTYLSIQHLGALQAKKGSTHWTLDRVGLPNQSSNGFLICKLIDFLICTSHQTPSSFFHIYFPDWSQKFYRLLQLSTLLIFFLLVS